MYSTREGHERICSATWAFRRVAPCCATNPFMIPFYVSLQSRFYVVLFLPPPRSSPPKHTTSRPGEKYANKFVHASVHDFSHVDIYITPAPSYIMHGPIALPPLPNPHTQLSTPHNHISTPCYTTSPDRPHQYYPLPSTVRPNQHSTDYQQLDRTINR